MGQLLGSVTPPMRAPVAPRPYPAVMTTALADHATQSKARPGAHRHGDHPDADGRWSCWDCGESVDTRYGLDVRDDCGGSSDWCAMCRRRRHAPGYECECSLSGLEYQRCSVCGRWELEPESADDVGHPVCHGCASASFGVGATLDAMLSVARASLLPFQRHATDYTALARRFADILPESDDPSVAHDYAEAFMAAAEALDGLARLNATVERVRIQNRERRS